MTDTLDKPISFSARNATLMEIMVQLAREAEISVMVEGIEAIRPKRLSIAIEDTPLGEVLDIISEAFGLRWHKDGMVYVFR